MNMDGTQMNADNLEDKELTGNIISAAFTVANELGCGFLESVYENAMMAELTMRGLNVRQQQPLQVWYKGMVVGQFFADLIVENRVMIELKHAIGIGDAHRAQCLNYLVATGMPLCLLINFGRPKIEYKRIIHTK